MSQRKIDHFSFFHSSADSANNVKRNEVLRQQKTSSQPTQTKTNINKATKTAKPKTIPLSIRSAFSNKRRTPPKAETIPFKKIRVLEDKQVVQIPETEQIPDTTIALPPTVPPLPTLSNKCLLLIFSFVRLRDLNTVAQVCQRWQTVANNNGFWKPPLIQRYPLFPWFKRMKLRPMGVCKHLFNTVPLTWGSPIPPIGAYIWHVSFSQLSRSQDKLQELMGVGKLFLKIGVEEKGTNKVFEKLNGTENSALLLVNRVIGKLCLFIPSENREIETYVALPWKKLPRDARNLVPFCDTNSAAMQLTIRNITGKEQLISIAMTKAKV